MKIIKTLLLLLLVSPCYGGQFLSDKSNFSIGMYHLNELSGTESKDESSFANPASLINGALFVSGKYGNCVYMDGSNDHIYTPLNTGIQQQFTTIIGMYQLDKGTNGYEDMQTFISGGWLNNCEFDYGAANGPTPQLIINVNGGTQVTMVFPTLAEFENYFFNRWRRIAITRGPNKVTSLYIDGVLIKAIPTLDGVSSREIRYGRASTYDSYIYKGYMDEIISVKRYYSKGEIEKDYANWRGKHSNGN